MRTEALAACGVLLCAAEVRALEAARPAEPRPALRYLELGLFPEVTLVGLSAGARFELLYRPFGRGTVSRLRLAPGFLAGPEFTYVPIALGYRAVLRPTRMIRPVLGTGLENQLRWVSDAPAAHQLAWYGEVGLLVAPLRELAVGVLGGLDFTFVGGPGPGITCRLGVTYTPGDRVAAAGRLPP